METESQRRECQSLHEQLNMVQQAHDEMVEENSMLKEEASDLQLQRLKLQATLERQERELASLRQKLNQQEIQLIDSHREQKQLQMQQDSARISQ